MLKTDVRAGRVLAAAFIALLAAGCGDSTGPELDIAGTWLYTGSVGEISPAPQLGQAECNVVKATILLARDGETITGTVLDHRILCTIIGEGHVLGPAPEEAVNGAFDDDELAIRFGPLESVGTLEGDHMSGDVLLEITIDGEPATLDGEWSATRE